jgi:hypothetical protein
MDGWKIIGPESKQSFGIRRFCCFYNRGATNLLISYMPVFKK